MYDPHGMRLFVDTAAHICEADPDLTTCAEAVAGYWPGNQVCLWLDTSLVPTEHLRDMPAPDAVWRDLERR